MLVLANELFDSPPVFAWVLPVFVRLEPGIVRFSSRFRLGPACVRAPQTRRKLFLRVTVTYFLFFLRGRRRSVVKR